MRWPGILFKEIDIDINARWSVDFMQDRFANGRRFRVLNVVDDVTKQCLASVVDTSTPRQLDTRYRAGG